jgi:hypothetical protein
MSGITNSRINVTLRQPELLAIKEFACATDSSLSQALLRLAMEKLEDYQDMLLAQKCLEREQEYKSSERFSMEDFEKAFDELPE